ncbi:YjcZ family sporulation protein, partial [Neobacillus drentensis]
VVLFILLIIVGTSFVFY